MRFHVRKNCSRGRRLYGKTRAGCSRQDKRATSDTMRCFLFWAGLVLFGQAANAERRELSLGAQPLYAVAYLPDQNAHGGGGVAHALFGLTDAVSILAFGGVTQHVVAANPEEKTGAGTLLAWHAHVGVSYALDIVRIQPFFEASAGVFAQKIAVGPEAKQTLQASVAIGVGADYLVSRRFSLGFAFRYHGVVTDLANLPIYLTVGPRAQFRFWL